MAVKLKLSDTYSTYFITYTCVEWISLFEITNTFDMVYDWFTVLREQHNTGVVAYVIMPNHLHIIVHFQKEGFDLNTIVGNGKRFLAYEIINRLEIAGNGILLNNLKSGLTAREKKKGQLHKVFKDSFDAKAIYSHKFLMQKINYIHNNPVNGKCLPVCARQTGMPAKDFIEYEHSSASFYEIQLVKHFRPMHYLDL